MMKILVTFAMSIASLIFAVPMAAAQDWNGAYVGFSLGFDKGDVDWTDNNGGWFTFAPGTMHSATGHGLGGGAHFGRNWQSGNNLVTGLEFSVSGLGNSRAVTSPLFPASDTWNTEVGTVIAATGRLGFASNKFMPYIEGGVAAGAVSMTNTDVVFCGATPCVFSSREWQTGWVAGIGLDYMASDNFSIGVNYRMADFGSTTHAGTTSGTAIAENFTVSAKSQVLSIRLNWLLK